MSALCRCAGIHRSSWTRWKTGATARTPSIGDWQRVMDTLAGWEAEAEAAKQRAARRSEAA